MLVAIAQNSNGVWTIRDQSDRDFSRQSLTEAAENMARGLKLVDGDRRLLVIHTPTGRVVEFRPPTVSWQLHREMWRTM
jgi:hypothetical protein